MNDDLISRQEAISTIIDEYYPNAIAIDIVDTIANLPSVTPQPKIGYWARQTDDYHDYYECENCGIAVGLDDVRNFCPNCGAKMSESEEKE